MNKQYENELEASLYYANKEIDKLKEEIKKLEEEKEYILSVIDKECIWDNHEWGYLKDFPKGKVRRMMMEFKKRKPLEEEL